MTETLSLAWLVTVRHWKVYKKYFWSNILPTFVEPCFFIFSLGVGLGSYVTDIDGLSYATYMGPGLAVSASMFTAFFESSYGFYVRMTMDGIYKAILTTPIGPREIILGELIWVSVKGAVMGMAVAAVMTVFGFLPYTPNIIGVLLVGFLVGGGCGSMGLIAAAMIKNISQFQTVYTVVISPLFFFSGIFFPIDKLPRFLQIVAHISPLYHGVVLNQLLLWNRMDGALFLQHLVELVVLDVLLLALAYKKVYQKLYN
jgi:lipooligosaccharide transport system permease protein